MIERKGSVFFYDTSEEKLSNNRRFRGTVTSLVSSRLNRASRWSSASTYQVFMMQSDLFILIHGWTTSLRILWLLVPRFVHATSIISLSLLPLRARSSFVRDDGQRRARLVLLLDRFPFPQENGQPTVSPVVVCRVVLSDRRARRQTKEGMLDQRLIRSRKCRREKFLGIPFCFNRSRDVYRFRGRTRFDLGWLEAFYNRRTEELEGWSLEGLFFFDKGPFYLFCFFELRIVIIFSPERIRLRTMHTGRKERLSRLRYYSE